MMGLLTRPPMHTYDRYCTLPLGEEGHKVNRVNVTTVFDCCGLLWEAVDVFFMRSSWS
jgi:hypothetical protein